MAGVTDDIDADRDVLFGQARKELAGMTEFLDLLVVGSRAGDPARRVLLGGPSTTSCTMRRARSSWCRGRRDDPPPQDGRRSGVGMRRPAVTRRCPAVADRLDVRRTRPPAGG